MTREEAIQAPTDGDLIRREDAIEAIQTAYCTPCKERGDDYNEVRCRACDYDNAIMQIDALPSAEAVHSWRTDKPTENGKYMVTLDSFGHKHIDLLYYGKPMMPNRKVKVMCWYHSDDEWGDVVYDDSDIFAWMPLPKPYREDGEA